MKQFDIKSGDVLVQYKGQPWVILARITTGHPYPHAALVHSISNNAVNIIEAGPLGVVIHPCPNIEDYEVWRPKCPDTVKDSAILWASGHKGERYGYGHLFEVLIGFPAGFFKHEGMDDDLSLDNRPKICSELIAMAFYRSGKYDLVPNVINHATLPYQLRNGNTMEFVGLGHLCIA